MPEFIQGLPLAEAFFHEVVASALPSDLRYAAARIGPGSEVLGFDDAMSTDHDWGPRLQIFLGAADAARGPALRDHLAATLPPTFRGWSTHFTPPDPEDNGTQHLQPGRAGAINHRVTFHTPAGFFRGYLGVDPSAPMSPGDWLAMPWHRLRAATSGGVFRDDVGLEAIRARLRWYPRGVWLHVMASVWQRIGQEEHLLGRTLIREDVLGARILAGRLVRDVMWLAFLMQRVYPTYPKWLGTAFGALESAPRLAPLLEAAWADQGALCGALEVLAGMHNALGVTPALDATRRRFFGRPFDVIGGERFAGALRAAIRDPAVRAMPLIGSVDVFSDNTDVLESPGLVRRG